jgi:hypothetical protein
MPEAVTRRYSLGAGYQSEADYVAAPARSTSRLGGPRCSANSAVRRAPWHSLMDATTPRARERHVSRVSNLRSCSTKGPSSLRDLMRITRYLPLTTRR